MAEIDRKTKRCPSDPTDGEWARIVRLPAASHRRGRSRGTDLREVLDAIRYRVSTGRGWPMPPQDLPPLQSGNWWFRRFVRRTLFGTIHEPALMPDRQRTERTEAPSTGVLDWRTVKAPTAGTDRGRGGARRTVGRKRHIAVDADGWLLMVNLTPAASSTAQLRRRCCRPGGR